MLHYGSHLNGSSAFSLQKIGIAYMSLLVDLFWPANAEVLLFSNCVSEIFFSTATFSYACLHTQLGYGINKCMKIGCDAFSSLS